MPKKKLTLSVDEDILNNAKKAEINLSAFLETRLVDYISDKEKCSRREGNSYLLVKIENTKDIEVSAIPTLTVQLSSQAIAIMR